MMPLLGQHWGASAEFAAVEQRLVARAPSQVPLLEAAALPLVSLTVMQALEPVVRVFGGVEFAIQYCAQELGMRVLTTCSAASAELLKSLGAERVIDYTQEDFDDVIDKHSLHVILDPLSYLYEERSTKLLRPGGHYVALASSPWEAASGDAEPLGLAIPESRLDRIIVGLGRSTLSCWLRSNVHSHHVYEYPDGQMLAKVAQLVDEGKVKPVVAEAFSLDDIRAAHESVVTGHTHGKIVIRLADEDSHVSYAEALYE
ncbi:zinc-binding dehydrogenase-domain-containing protein [Pavlovales sp. CCMP2436]|nr:zinc-binding dehydrogenase-domain-containing protein [Pavlovales sp. CCMP2436]